MAGQRSTGLAAVLAAALIFALAAPAFVGPCGLRSGSSPAGTVEVALRGASPSPLPEEDTPAPFKFGGAALSMLAALVVALMPVAEAKAAKMGGRMGGTAPSQQKSRPAPPRPAPAPAPSSSNTTVNKTVVNKTVVVQQSAPVMMAPPVVAGPSMGEMIVGNVVGNVVGNAISNTIMPRGPSGTDQMISNQQRQDERQMDKQAMELESLKREMQDMKIAAVAKS